jgi:hypothetical protein
MTASIRYFIMYCSPHVIRILGWTRYLANDCFDSSCTFLPCSTICKRLYVTYTCISHILCAHAYYTCCAHIRACILRVVHTYAHAYHISCAHVRACISHILCARTCMHITRRERTYARAYYVLCAHTCMHITRVVHTYVHAYYVLCARTHVHTTRVVHTYAHASFKFDTCAHKVLCAELAGQEKMRYDLPVRSQTFGENLIFKGVLGKFN